MTLLAPLIPFVCWLVFIGQDDLAARFDSSGVVLFLAVYALLVGVMAAWGRWLARRITIANFESNLRRFNQITLAARLGVIAWFIFGMFGGLNWGESVLAMLGPIRRWPVELPGAILATLPAFAASAGLWWTQYPADRAFREQTLLLRLESDLPVHAPPGPWRSFIANFRLKVLFVVVPVLMVLALRDLITVSLSVMGYPVVIGSGIEQLLLLGSSIAVFALAPEILRFVLHTQPLDIPHLRTKLEALCRQNGIRYRDILVWRTDFSVGNAAVMGVAPWFRYVLLSDLLIATMTDEQIEAVFAHEAGHIKNHHMFWYVVLIVALLIGFSGPLDWLKQVQSGWVSAWLSPDQVGFIVEAIFTVGFVLLFGVLSRRFERQADIYAVRWMQKSPPPPNELLASDYGVAVFNSALYRVAAVNNIPIHSRNFTHGSIATRMSFLQDVGRNPDVGQQFERWINVVKLGMLMALMIGIGIAYLMRERLFSA